MKIKELASKMEYPGRFIIMGNNKENLFAVYGVTARSASSKAKRYVLSKDKKSICVEATDINVMNKGNLSLLDYTAVRFFHNGLIIGNGRQTIAVENLNIRAFEQITESLEHETYELDKYSTPRITGCIANINNAWSQAVHIIRNDGMGKSIRECFGLPIQSEQALFISTYAGPNIRPTPSFLGKPISIEALKESPKQIAEYVYNAFGPLMSKEDLRVSVVAVSINKDIGETAYYIINAVDR